MDFKSQELLRLAVYYYVNKVKLIEEDDFRRITLLSRACK